MISSLRRPSRFIPLGVLLVLAGAAFWFWKGAQSSTLASEDTALADFHARAAQGTFTPRPGVPTPGVYHFRQSGSEKAGSGAPHRQPRPPRRGRLHRQLHEGRATTRISVTARSTSRRPSSRVNAAGTRALWRRSKVTFLGIGEDDKAPVTPPAARPPRPT